jgi:hypothetical protein
MYMAENGVNDGCISCPPNTNTIGEAVYTVGNSYTM